MSPAIVVGGRVKFSKPLLSIRRIEQRGTGRDEQAYREVDRIDMLDQVSLFKECEKLQVALQRFPGRERHERWAQGDTCRFHQYEGFVNVGARMTFIQSQQHIVVQRFDG